MTKRSRSAASVERSAPKAQRKTTVERSKAENLLEVSVPISKTPPNQTHA